VGYLAIAVCVMEDDDLGRRKRRVREEALYRTLEVADHSDESTIFLISWGQRIRVIVEDSFQSH
jgi:hypothetical protein